MSEPTPNTPPKFHTAETFSILVETRWAEENGRFTHLEVACIVLGEIGMDPEDGNALISKSLKEIIRCESSQSRLLKERFQTNKITL